ncbi:MAG: winged helix DNA-binding domain-containing protein, partial [Limisphaerales bacterium]
REEIQTALWKNRTLVRTSCMRQTLHLIPAVDFALYIKALKKGRTEFLAKIMSRYAGVTQKETDALNEMIVEALSAGPLTQAEIIERILPEVGKKMKKWMQLAWSIQIFRSALIEGLICYGPEKGKKTTFIRVDRWLPGQRKISEEKAQQILLRRYLSAYGPATLRDFSKWMGVSAKEANPVWQSLRDELFEVSVEGSSGFILRKDYEQLAESGPIGQNLRLLPHFDSYMLGHADRSQLVEAAHYKQVYRKAGWISPVILLNGRAAGTWFYTRPGSRLSLKIEPFATFSKTACTKIEEEAERLGNFLKISWEVKFGRL